MTSTKAARDGMAESICSIGVWHPEDKIWLSFGDHHACLDYVRGYPHLELYRMPLGAWPTAPDPSVLEPYASLAEVAMDVLTGPAEGVGEMLTMAAVAALLGVSYETVQKWRIRPVGFPSPDLTVNTSPLWYRETVVEWAQATGRGLSDS